MEPTARYIYDPTARAGFEADWAWLALALLLPLLFLLHRQAERRRFRALAALVSPPLVARLTVGSALGRRRLGLALLAAGVALAAAALTRPRWATSYVEPVTRRGIDIVVALDISRSMLASDLAPSRLDRAKREVRDLLARIRERGTDRMGLVLFAGRARIACPLTADLATLEIFLSAADPVLAGRGGTRLGDAIRTALEALGGGGTSGGKAIVLITDGGDQDSDPAAAAREAAERGVIVHTVGIGSPQGSFIAFEDEDGREAIVKDKAGNPVLSRLEEASLAGIAQETGGAYVRAGAPDSVLVALYDGRLADLPGRTVHEDRARLTLEAFQFPLALALLAFLGHAWTAGRSG